MPIKHLKIKSNLEIERQPVPSANLESVGYDEKNETLEVEFLHSGEIYRYSNISRTTFDAMMGASTPGQYFYHFIRTSYPYYQI